MVSLCLFVTLFTYIPPSYHMPTGISDGFWGMYLLQMVPAVILALSVCVYVKPHQRETARKTKEGTKRNTRIDNPELTERSDSKTKTPGCPTDASDENEC